jgi:hypothetical protein
MKTLLKLLALSLIAGASAYAADTTWPGTLYRNGGHYGMQNSDEQLSMNLKMDSSLIAGAPSDPANSNFANDEPSQAWKGTLYRNGGNYGLENSDEQLHMGE